MLRLVEAPQDQATRDLGAEEGGLLGQDSTGLNHSEEAVRIQGVEQYAESHLSPFDPIEQPIRARVKAELASDLRQQLVVEDLDIEAVSPRSRRQDPQTPSFSNRTL